MKLTVNKKDITSIVGNITLDSNLDTLGDQLSFEIAYSNMKYYPKVTISPGDLIQLFSDDNKEVFRGIIIDKTKSENTQSFSCFDFAFYLNKSKVIKQFNKVKADVAIKQLLQEFNVPINVISPMSVVIKKIYYDKEVSEIIKDILADVTKATGSRFVMEMKNGKLSIYKDTEMFITAKVKISNTSVDVAKTLSGPSRKESIEEMKNSIKLYTGDEKKVKVIAEVKDAALIAKYGLLQETQSLEDKDIAKAKNIAKNLLKDLGKVMVEGSVEVLGHFDLRAGRIIVLNEPITGLVGKYKIKSVNHSIGTIHTCRLDLEEVS